MASRRVRTTSPAEPELGLSDGLAWARFAPAGPPRGSLLVVHGAGSGKESHFDYARLAAAAGWCALCFDVRGHGSSEGVLGAGALDDLARMAAELPGDVPLALRGSSMGGYMVVMAAAAVGAAAVAAICPAPAAGLASALAAGRFDFAVDAPALAAFLATHDDLDAVSTFTGGLLLLHAEGDEVVPVAHSVALEAAAIHAHPRTLRRIPGGHHRSIQHDPALQAESLRWLADAAGVA